MVRSHALNTCKNEDQVKNEGARVATTFLPLQVYVFFKTLKDRLLGSPQLNYLIFELILDLMLVLVTCKNEEYTIKECARVATRLYVDFPTLNGR